MTAPLDPKGGTAVSRSVVVTVTPEDIAAGTMMNGRSCPLARAIRREAAIEGLHVEAHRIVLFEGARPFTYLSKKAERFVRAFDDGKPVRPATFRLRIPDHEPGW